MTIPLGCALRRTSSNLPGNLSSAEAEKLDGPSLRLPYLVLHRMGFALPSVSRRMR